jgi:hypothetical protein
MKPELPPWMRCTVGISAAVSLHRHSLAASTPADMFYTTHERLSVAWSQCPIWHVSVNHMHRLLGT